MVRKAAEHLLPTCSFPVPFLFLEKNRMSTSTDRDANGRFRPGHPGGPGRPRRAVEADYLATLSDAVPLDRWRAIVARAVEDAEQGDAKARAWLTDHLIGKLAGDPLLMLAAAELAEFDPIAEQAEKLAWRGMIAGLGSVRPRTGKGTAHDDRA
jgi:hypothetical protein